MGGYVEAQGGVESRRLGSCAALETRIANIVEGEALGCLARPLTTC